MGASKPELRARIRAARAQRLLGSGEPTHRDGERILAAALEAGLLPPGVRIATYLAAPGEPDTASLRAAVRDSHGVVLLAVPEPGRTLGWAPDDGRYRLDSRLPVPRPVGDPVARGAAGLRSLAVRAILAPALAVDLRGARLGQGGGYFDALVADLDGDPPVIAVLHDDELLPAGTIPEEPHDRRVAGVLKPSGFIALPHLS